MNGLLPLPGTARPAAPGRGEGAGPVDTGPVDTGPVDERLLGRIRALLAKAEATEFAEEAEALSARAQQLMAKYSIDHALLAAREGHAEAPGGRRLAVDNPYDAPKVTLLSTVARANRCRTVWLKELGLVTVIGFPADLDAVELLFTSLLVQADGAMLRAGGKKDAYGRSRTRAFRQSFLVSYAVRIGERLAEAAGQAEREAVAEQEAALEQEAGRQREAAHGGGRDLVPFLAARHRAVDDAVAEMFGDGLTRSRAVRATDAEGWYSGRAAADLASLRGHAAVADSAPAGGHRLAGTGRAPWRAGRRPGDGAAERAKHAPVRMNPGLGAAASARHFPAGARPGGGRSPRRAWRGTASSGRGPVPRAAPGTSPRAAAAATRAWPRRGARRSRRRTG